MKGEYPEGEGILKAFGDLAYEITYEECTKEIADNPKTIFKPDYKHIENVLEIFKPKIVITFGNYAYDAFTHSCSKFFPDIVIKAPHPASRQPNTLNRLKEIARELEHK